MGYNMSGAVRLLDCQLTRVHHHHHQQQQPFGAQLRLFGLLDSISENLAARKGHKLKNTQSVTKY